MTIRAATPDDIPAMRAVEVDAGERFRAIGMHAVADDPPPSAEVLMSHIANGTAWVAVEGDGAVVGYALASTVDGEGHLDQVSVRTGASGRGIGAALVAVVVAWSATQGHPAVTLTTYRDVPWNGPWYARLGFEEIVEAALTPGLRAILEQQRAAGLEPPTRIAMRRVSQLRGRNDLTRLDPLRWQDDAMSDHAPGATGGTG